MLRWLAVIALCALAGGWTHGIPGGPVAFTPLHLFFVSPTGSDANDGLAPTVGGGHGPWATPNHAVSCGDVILAAAGDYSTSFSGVNFGAVLNCPSTSGGIDGTGGIYFATLLCAGSDLEACHTSGVIWDVGKNNWSFQGWKVDFASVCTGAAGSGCGSSQRGFQFDGCAGPVHHFAAINNVFYRVATAVHGDDCGQSGVGMNFGVDYMAAVGNIGVQASMNGSTCEAAFDAVGMFPLDTNAGTHVYFYTNYTSYDDAGTDCNVFDSEAFMFDTWGAHAYSNTGVVANNISWKSKRYCVNFFTSGSQFTITPTMKAYNNTCFSNLVNISADSSSGELYISTGEPWIIQVYNNIAFNPNATSGASNPIYALINGGGLNSGAVVGGTGKENILKGSAVTCAGTCDAGNNVSVFNANPVPTGIFVNPGYNNTTDLLANRLLPNVTPSCAGFINTTACMGWNANTRVLTNPSVIYDLQPDPNCGSVANQCVGKGFQLPSTTCGNSGDIATDYPVWLKGMVYLHASGFTAGATITQNVDLATRHCGT